MGRDRDDSPPENAKDVVEDREVRRKPSAENSGGAGTGSVEEDVNRRETRRRTRDDEESGSGSGLESDNASESEEEERRGSRKARGKRKARRRRGRDDDGNSDTGSDSESESESDYSSEYSDSEESESEEERRRRKRKERKRREREEERERKRRRREKEKKKRRRREKEEERERERKRKEKKKKKEKKEKSEKGKKGAVTNLWGKYGIIRETDMWNKRPEFTAWLAEIKQVNLESLPPWEEKKMFKEFMEDHNTATFPSKKYYDIDAYYRQKMEKERKKGFKKVVESERTVFNDEEQRRLELQQAREKQKEEQVLALKRSMEGGMAQAMREQARLREEMAYLYKIGNIEAAAAIQKRLDPDVAM